MIVTDSRTRDAVRPVFLTFDPAKSADEPFRPHGDEPHDGGGPAQGSACFGRHEVVAPDAIVDFEAGGSSLTARLKSGATIEARLLVAADGVRSTLRDIAGIGTIDWDYRQSGIVCTVGHQKAASRPRRGAFPPRRPFRHPAAESRRAHRSSLVWTEASEDADRLVAGDQLVFEVELERRFGHRLGN